MLNQIILHSGVFIWTLFIAVITNLLGILIFLKIQTIQSRILTIMIFCQIYLAVAIFYISEIFKNSNFKLNLFLQSVISISICYAAIFIITFLILLLAQTIKRYTAHGH